MANNYTKARVQLLNEATGEPITEVEIITDSREIFYSNDNPTKKVIGKLPVNTTFDKTSVSDILDNILYEDVDPSIEYCTSSNGEFLELSHDLQINKPYGSIVEPYSISTKVIYGTENDVTCTLVLSRTDGYNKEVVKTISKPTLTSISTVVTFDIEDEIREDTDVRVYVNGSNYIRHGGAVIKYRFISPIYVGWVDPKRVLDDVGEIDKQGTEEYLKTLIDHLDDFNILEQRYVTKSDQYAMVTPGVNYNTRQKLNPFILIPQSWGELKAITDINNNNIINSYKKLIDVSICNVKDNIERYIIYVCKYTFNNDEEFVRGIKYIFDERTPFVNMDKYASDGIPLMNSYSMNTNIPLDDRSVVQTYGELLKMKYPYPGLLTYVVENNTTFRYNGYRWSPAWSKWHIVENTDILKKSYGGWDDIAINVQTGRLYTKRYNDVWEMWGELGVSTENGKVELIIKVLDKEVLDSDNDKE